MFSDLEPKISSERDVIWVVNALYDSGCWSFEDVSDWAVEIISRVDEPACWFFNLIFPSMTGEEEHLPFASCREAKSCNSNFDAAICDDLLVGFILMGGEHNQQSWEATLCKLVDAVDGSHISEFQPEDFAHLKMPCEKLIVLQRFCEDLPAQIAPEKLLADYPEMFRA